MGESVKMTPIENREKHDDRKTNSWERRLETGTYCTRVSLKIQHKNPCRFH